MNTGDIDAALDRAERALAEGKGLRGTRFWPAVGAVRRDRSLAGQFADRIAAIDRRAFEQGVRWRVPAAVGLVGLVAVTAVGAVGVILAARAGAPPPSAGAPPPSSAPLLWARVGGLDLYHLPGFVPAAFLIGLGGLILGTHSLAHWVVGRALGIRFTHVFIGGPKPPRPGLKTDYASYLRAAPAARAVMHASGAVVTKLVPFALLPITLRFYNLWPWLTWIVLAVGVVQVLTDVLLSTKVSDWKKVLREVRAAVS